MFLLKRGVCGSVGLLPREPAAADPCTAPAEWVDVCACVCARCSCVLIELRLSKYLLCAVGGEGRVL